MRVFLAAVLVACSLGISAEAAPCGGGQCRAASRKFVRHPIRSTFKAVGKVARCLTGCPKH